MWVTLRRLNPRLVSFAVLAVLWVGPHLPHLAGPIDDPQSWRQCDTAQYAYSFFREGVSLLRPSVIWMGGYKTVVLEFPLPELLMALAYRAFGFDLKFSRLVTLSFFLGSAVYLLLIVRHLFGSRLATECAAVYGILPLALFYSRAIHIDFAAVFFGHAFTYHAMRSCDLRSPAHALFASIAGVLGCLIKAPYVFYFALPLIAYAARSPRTRVFPYLATPLITSAAAFAIWRMHVEATNGLAPDWSFIPGYIKHVDMGGWYYGPLSTRLQWSPWRELLSRTRSEVTSSWGFWLCSLGLVVSLYSWARRRATADDFIAAWALGLLGYVLIFFNLNVFHDYYQIPLLALASVLIARALDLPVQLWGKRFPTLALFATVLAFALLAFKSIQWTERYFYQVDWLRVEAGRLIEENTPRDALVIASTTTHTNPRDPRLLERAHRYGWSIYRDHLTPELVERLTRFGATHVVLVVPEDEPTTEILGRKATTLSLHESPWKLLIAHVSAQRPQAERGGR